MVWWKRGLHVLKSKSENHYFSAEIIKAVATRHNAALLYHPEVQQEAELDQDFEIDVRNQMRGTDIEVRRKALQRQQEIVAIFQMQYNIIQKTVKRR